jgi:rSAM/selenodomain-associated transferase 1
MRPAVRSSTPVQPDRKRDHAGPRLVVMVKVPHAGRVKTRLAREIGVVAATSFYRHAAAAVIRRVATGTPWRTRLAVAPDTAHGGRPWSAHRPGPWPPGIPRQRQGVGDLGRRMQRIMDGPGRGPTVIIGTDIPAIRATHIASAFRALARGDAVLGPTPDGGYWLVGLKRSPRVLRPFALVRWSSEHARADTAANLAGCTIALAALLDDVDDAACWNAVRGWSGRVVLPSRPTTEGVSAPATALVMEVTPA